MEHQFPLLPFFYVLLVLFFIFLRKWKKNNSKDINVNLPPAPRKLPIIGNLHQLVGSPPHHRLRELASKYGPLMHLQLGEVSNVVISSPEAAKEVMKTHDLAFAQRPTLLAENVITSDCMSLLFAPYGDYWRQLRRIFILELLSSRRVKSFRSIREEEVSKLIASISSGAGSVINLSRMISSLTYSITSRAAFGGMCKDQEAFVLIAEKIPEVAAGFSFSDVFPSVKLLHMISGMRTEIRRLHREGSKTLEVIINEHKASKKMGTKDDVEHILDVLLNHQDDGDLEFPLTNDHIKSIILDIFIAGSETSSTALEWAMSELLKNPRVMEKAQAESRQVFGAKGYVNEAGLEKLDYLKMVIKETLRLHPPAPLLLPRECGAKCEINGFDIPVKTRVIINAWAIGRDPSYWNEPERFYPERFVDNSVDYKGANFEFIPFGSGRRMCPGIAFAIANIQLPLAQLLYHFDWKLPAGINSDSLDMVETFGVTVRRKRDLFSVPIPYQPQTVD